MAKMQPPAISILLPTYNNAATLSDTLQSVQWAGEILVIDSFSTDATLEICARFNCRVIQHEYINSARQKNWALPHCRHEWVLQIDSDETLATSLQEEISSCLRDVPQAVDAFRMPRKNHILGKWCRHGGLYPDYQVRLFRKDKGRWTAREVHASIVVPGEVRTLQGAILHQGMPTLARQIANLNRYTRYEADELLKQGRRFSAYRLLIHPWLIFAYRYFFQQGFRDGWRGFIFCAYTAFYSFLVWAKRWELDEIHLDQSPK
jgi:glycosyltransferase involved in cell wall biosynthesis